MLCHSSSLGCRMIIMMEQNRLLALLLFWRQSWTGYNTSSTNLKWRHLHSNIDSASVLSRAMQELLLLSWIETFTHLKYFQRHLLFWISVTLLFHTAGSHYYGRLISQHRSLRRHQLFLGYTLWASDTFNVTRARSRSCILNMRAVTCLM